MELGERMGLQGKELKAFVVEQQSVEREDRHKERELRGLELENEEATHRRELEMKKIELDGTAVGTRTVEPEPESKGRTGKFPKLPTFQDGIDKIESYLQRFERFAASNSWPKSEWAKALSALLTGKALDVYSRMPDETAVNYDLLKEALLKQYDLTTDGYRDEFGKSRPQLYENPEQFVTRLKSYLDKWILLSHTDDLATGIKELFIREQFINACPKNLAIHLRETELPNLEELTQAAGIYLVAQNRKFHSASTSFLISAPSEAVGHDDI